MQPNTEMKLYYDDEDGWGIPIQSFEEIVLSVKKVGENGSDTIPLTEIKAAPDKYTRYVADYVGRNVYTCGYTALSGNRMAEYGDSHVQLNLIAADGSFVDLEDDDALKKYYVTSQSIAPNTEINITYDTDSDGNEYSWADSQNIEEIDLYIAPVE